jgi:hypothetical protein
LVERSRSETFVDFVATLAGRRARRSSRSAEMAPGAGGRGSCGNTPPPRHPWRQSAPGLLPTLTHGAWRVIPPLREADTTGS